VFDLKSIFGWYHNSSKFLRSPDARVMPSGSCEHIDMDVARRDLSSSKENDFSKNGSIARPLCSPIFRTWSIASVVALSLKSRIAAPICLAERLLMVSTAPELPRVRSRMTVCGTFRANANSNSVKLLKPWAGNPIVASNRVMRLQILGSSSKK